MEIQREFNEVKQAIRDLAQTTQEGFRKMHIKIARVEGDIADLKRNSATKAELRALRSEMNGRFDEFMPLIEAGRRDRQTASDHYMGLQDRLSDHERRIKTLEDRPKS